MYQDGYYPKLLVDRLRDILKELVSFLDSRQYTTQQVQDELDRLTQKINDLRIMFEEEGSELETVARESIASNIKDILSSFEIPIGIEEAIRRREW
jgi:hypothetical protein